MHAASIKHAGPIDAALGSQIRARRLAKGISQSSLASRVGVAVEQIQGYEKGAVRAGIGRLIEIAGALRLPLNTFLQQLEQAPTRRPQDDDPIARLSHRQAVRLAKAFATLQPRCARGARRPQTRRTPMRSAVSAQSHSHRS